MTDEEKFPPEKNFPADYVPPEIWKWEKESGGNFASINRPVAGPTHDKELPVGKHPIQLYSLATPNGVKVTILLEELLAAGHAGAEYDAWLINIGEGEQFSSGFVDLNPNSKIPTMADHAPADGGAPVRLFESGSMMVYLAEKFGAFLPADARTRAETMNWVFWQMGATPYLGGGFGHFYAYAPMKIEYAIDRYAMEVKRQLDVLDRHLAQNEYMAAGQYTIADMIIWPWYGRLVSDGAYDSAKFLDVASYKHVRRWTDMIGQREPVRRGRMVNKSFGELSQQLRERHDASDFETRTQDKLQGE